MPVPMITSPNRFILKKWRHACRPCYAATAGSPPGDFPSTFPWISRREFSINNEVIKLTAFEYTIMETLIRNNGKVVSKDSLMLQLYPDAELRESHTIDVLMGRLRKKIQAQYPHDVITTVRGQGYLFELR